MSHIIDFSIEGLAGRKDTFTCKLNRGCNVFFGLNGSGKTSLLKILHSAMRRDKKILSNVPFKSATVRIYSIEFDKTFTRSIKKIITENEDLRSQAVLDGGEIIREQQDIGSTASDLGDWTHKPKMPEKATRTSWAHRYLPTSRLHIEGRWGFSQYELKVTGQKLSPEDEVDAIFADSLQRLWKDYISEIGLAVREAQEQGLANILKTVLASPTTNGKNKGGKINLEIAFNRVQKFLERRDSQSLLSPFKLFKTRYDKDQVLRDVVVQINRVEEDIEKAMTSRDRLQEIIQKMVSGNKEIVFGDDMIKVLTDNSNEIGLLSLSSGEKHLLRILMETLLSKGNTILIDEPELSMHIDWQHDLIPVMQVLNPSTQIIVATHSPEIMDEVSDDKIFRM